MIAQTNPDDTTSDLTPVSAPTSNSNRASGPVDADTAFRRVRADTGLQWDLAHADTFEAEPRERRERRDTSLFWVIVVDVAKYLLWGALGIVILGILWFVFQSLRDVRLSRRAAEAAKPDAPLYEPTPARVRTLLGEVDELAAQGLYTEAVHALLFRAIADIDRARPGAVRRSLTAREIARLPGISDRTRTAFVAIARINERGWFAGQPVTREQFEAARAAYAQFDGRAQSQPRLSGAPGAAGAVPT